MTGQELARDRIRGCMIGGAVGDALGWPVEFQGERQIFDHYGSGGIGAYDLDAAGVAEITDDTQMALFTANALLVGETRERLHGDDRLPRQFAAIAYQDWLITQDGAKGEKTRLRPGGISWLSEVAALWHRRGPGGTCLSALRLQNEAPGNIPDYIDAELNDSKGCGGIMRVAPMGLRPWGDIRVLDWEGAQIAAVTHGHPLGYMPAAVLTHIVNRLVFPKGDMGLKDIVLEARDAVSELFAGEPFLEKLRRIIDRAVDLAEKSTERDLENIHRLGEGWVAEETLGIALYCCLRHPYDFSAGVIAAVNHKGDSDSTGAVTGNILGAHLGFDAIDDRWKRNLELYDVILEIADDLARPEGEEYSAEWMRKYDR